MPTGNFDNYVVKRFKDNPKEATYHLKQALVEYKKNGELSYLLMAIKDVVKARGVCEIAKKAGLTRQGLWKALRANGELKISTLKAILNALNYSFTFNFYKIK